MCQPRGKVEARRVVRPIEDVWYQGLAQGGGDSKVPYSEIELPMPGVEPEKEFRGGGTVDPELPSINGVGDLRQEDLPIGVYLVLL